MVETQCWPREKLKAYLAGWADVEQSDSIESHLAQCPSCEQTVVELEANPDTLVALLHEVSHQPAQPRVESIDPGLASALSEARHLMDPSEASQLDSTWEPPTTEIGAYELVRTLGRGGMGAVYLARHRQLGKQVAIKLLPARSFRDDHFALRFQREIRAAGGLDHPAIVQATDAGESEGTHYLVMEFIDGLDVSQITRRVGKFSFADACEITRQVALGLSYAHAEGIVHRDIKPSNLMLDKSGQAKILDFGLARMGPWDEASKELTTVGQLMGTLDYMAPEQAERAESVDYRADLYSLGATLFRLLCGRPPLAASPDLSPLAKLRLLATHEPPSLATLRPDAPPELVQLVGSMLARDPAARPASAAHVADELTAFCANNDLPGLLSEAVHAASQNAITLQSSVLPALPKPAADSNATRSGHGGWTRWLVAACALPLFIVAGVLITLELQKGQLVIESDAKVSVSIVQDGQPNKALQLEPGVNSTRLFAGKYQVVIDEGSDNFQVTGGDIVIRRGETEIARVKKAVSPPSAVASSPAFSPLPASNSPLQPGDALRVESLNDSVLKTSVIVMADSTIKLPLVGTVSVRGLTVDDLDSKLNRLYSEFLKDPFIEVFRDLSTQSFQASAPPSPSQMTNALSGGAPATTKKTEIVFQGRTLNEWLETLALEKSDAGLTQAFEAVGTLVKPETAEYVSNFLLELLPKLDGKRGLQGDGQRSRTMDSYAFAILRKANGDDKYFRLLRDQLETSDSDAWQRRILDYDAIRIPIELGNFRELHQWIVANVLGVEEPTTLLIPTAELYAKLINYSSTDEGTKEWLLGALDESDHLTHDFWLGNQKVTAILKPVWMQQLAQRAIAAIADRQATSKHCAQAAVILRELDLMQPSSSVEFDRELGTYRGFGAKSNMPRSSSIEIDREALVDAIGRRLAALSSEPDRLFSLVAIDATPLGESARPGNLLACGGLEIGTRDTTSAESVGRLMAAGQRRSGATNEALELIDLASRLNLADELLPQLIELARVTQDMEVTLAKSIGASVDPFDFDPTHVQSSDTIYLLWPSLTVPSNRAAEFTADISPEQWIAHILLSAAIQALPDNSARDIREQIRKQYQLEWAREKIAEVTQGEKETLTYDEFDALMLPVDFQAKAADSNHDLQVSVQELVDMRLGLRFDMLASMIAWAERMFQKYDVNRDEKLSESEVKAMIIKPIGADTNQDGFISVEEYAKFRMSKKNE